MKLKATYLFGFFVFLFASGISSESLAQPSFGVIWDAPSDTAVAVDQLNTFSALGVTHLEVDHPLAEPIKSILYRADFTILIRSQNYFFTLSEIHENQDQLLDDYLGLAEEYRSMLNAGGLGLLSHSQTYDPDFETSFKPLLDSLSVYSNKSFYYFYQNAWFDFRNPEQAFGILYNDEDYQPADLSEIDSRINFFVADNSNRLLFFNSSWLLEATDKYPELIHSLLILKENNTWELPLPNTDNSDPDSNWIVLILLILWVALAFQIKYFPYARPMISRYFLAHRFFVDDILHYRERNATASIFMMMKHALFGGLAFYIIAHILFSEIGLEAFFHQIPWLAITGANYFSLFLSGFLVIILIQIIAVLWIHLPGKTLEHFSQTFNLYAGPFYLDYLILTLMVTLFVTGSGNTLILILFGLYVLIWYASFNITSFDASRNMGSSQFLYLLITIGLHSLVSLFLLIYVLLHTNMIEILDLAISL
ncbi:MAG TPA: hypothetical protein VFM80_09270 [Gracilimonas sp.]|uniref:hypothetical protein n=1 Tax=Gracilimonas sp. TaxID=1974203 RepID=UPI002D8DDADA|nr:hypothetical protein [Gracilimonas sp.]